MPTTCMICVSLRYMLLDNRVILLERANEELRVQLANAERRADSLVRSHEQKHQCESQYAQGRIYDAAQSLLQMMDSLSEDVRGNKIIMDWLIGESDIGNWDI